MAPLNHGSLFSRVIQPLYFRNCTDLYRWNWIISTVFNTMQAQNCPVVTDKIELFNS